MIQGCNPPMDCVGCLWASALATELTADQVDMLFNRVEVRELSKNEILISEGDHDDRLYAIAKGELGIYQTAPRGQESSARLGAGTITGELAFLDGREGTETVKAENNKCCVIALRRNQLESLLSDAPILVYKVMRAVVRSAHQTVGKRASQRADRLISRAAH